MLLVGKKIKLIGAGNQYGAVHKCTDTRSQVMTHFDQCNEQTSTDSGKKDGQNLGSQGSHGRLNFMNIFGFLDILDTGSFR